MSSSNFRTSPSGKFYGRMYSINGYLELALGNDALPTPGAGLNYAIGERAMYNGGLGTLTSSDNVAIGAEALYNIVDSSGNVAVGNYAGRGIVSGISNVSIGSESLFSGDASFSCAIGRSALKLSSGLRNTALGVASGYGITDGGGNTCLGASSGAGLVSGDNSTAVGYAAMSYTDYSNCTALGYYSAVTADNQVQLGNSSTTTYAYGAVQDRSDERDKTDISDSELGLNFILALRPVEFRWDYREDYTTQEPDGEDIEIIKRAVTVVDGEARIEKFQIFDPSDNELMLAEEARKSGEDITILRSPRFKAVHHERDGSKKRTRKHQGLIAQEVKAVMEELGVDFGGYQDHSIKGGQDVLSLGYQELIPVLIKAIQELATLIRLSDKQPNL